MGDQFQFDSNPFYVVADITAPILENRLRGMDKIWRGEKWKGQIISASSSFAVLPPACCAGGGGDLCPSSNYFLASSSTHPLYIVS